jgi:hypothetical protein
MRIKNPDERWFEIENDPDGARVKIKNLTPGEMNDILDKAFRLETEYIRDDKGKLQPKMHQINDRNLDREETLKACIVAWENFFDKNGEPLDRTPYNIIRAAREIDGFIEMINEFRDRLRKDIKQEEEEQEKNLLNTQAEA